MSIEIQNILSSLLKFYLDEILFSKGIQEIKEKKTLHRKLKAKTSTLVLF